MSSCRLRPSRAYRAAIDGTSLSRKAGQDLHGPMKVLDVVTSGINDFIASDVLLDKK